MNMRDPGLKLDSTLLRVIDCSVHVPVVAKRRTGTVLELRCSPKLQQSVDVSAGHLLFGIEQLSKLEGNTIRIRGPVVPGTGIQRVRRS